MTEQERKKMLRMITTALYVQSANVLIFTQRVQ
jgi:hypothetical protein